MPHRRSGRAFPSRAYCYCRLSILFICHDISLVQQFADRVLVMYQGNIVEEGTPAEVICHPKNDYTKRLIDSVL